MSGPHTWLRDQLYKESVDSSLPRGSFAPITRGNGDGDERGRGRGREDARRRDHESSHLTVESNMN